MNVMSSATVFSIQWSLLPGANEDTCWIKCARRYLGLHFTEVRIIINASLFSSSLILIACQFLMYTLTCCVQIWKSLETTEKTLVDMIQVKDYDITRYFVDEGVPPRSPHEAAKHRSDRLETETYYLEVSRAVLLSEMFSDFISRRRC